MGNPHKGRTGIDRVVRALGYSMQGLGLAIRSESAFRQEGALALVMVPAAFWLGQTWVEVVLLAGTVVLVLIVELLNSGLEAAIDRVSYDMHELSKRAKDFGSAAVLLCNLQFFPAVKSSANRCYDSILCTALNLPHFAPQNLCQSDGFIREIRGFYALSYMVRKRNIVYVALQ